MRSLRSVVVAAAAALAVAATVAPSSSAAAPATLSVSGRSGTSVEVTLPRTVVTLNSLVGDAKAQYAGLAFESLTARRYVGALVKLTRSIGVIGEGNEPLTLPAGRYRVHLVGDLPSLTVRVGVNGSRSQRLVATRPSSVKASLTPLNVAGQVAAGRFTGNLTLKPGGLTVLAYRAQAFAAPAGVVDLGLYGDDVNDPNNLFPAAGFGPLPLPFATTIIDGVEALVFAVLARVPNAPAAKSYRQQVNVATSAVMLRRSEVFSLVTG